MLLLLEQDSRRGLWTWMRQGRRVRQRLRPAHALGVLGHNGRGMMPLVWCSRLLLLLRLLEGLESL